MLIGIVNHGLGNIGSITRSISYYDHKYKLVSHKDDLISIDKIIIPGVGSFDNAIYNLNKFGLTEFLKDKILTGTPTLGICLGMQLLFTDSEEGSVDGLNIISSKIIKLKTNNKLNHKLPNVGWKRLKSINKSLLTKNIDDESLYYFANSYGCSYNKNLKYIKSTYSHEKDYAAIIEHNNLFGVQFHPEKSKKPGYEIINNFIKI